MASVVSIRPARSRPELESVLDVARRVSGGPVPAVDELEHALANEPGSLFLLAHLDDDLIASGVGKVSSLSGCLFAMVRVLPEFRRRGIGSAMYATLSEHARSVGREQLFGRVREDDEGSLSAVQRRGFREIGREFPVVLDLSSATKTASAPDDGVEITTLGQAARPCTCRVGG